MKDLLKRLMAAQEDYQWIREINEAEKLVSDVVPDQTRGQARKSKKRHQETLVCVGCWHLKQSLCLLRLNNHSGNSRVRSIVQNSRAAQRFSVKTRNR